MKYPTITAVMVTLGRMELVKESYRYFCNQTYPAKELLIVTDGKEQEHNALKKLAHEDHRVKVLHVGGKRRTLGELRNLSIEYGKNLSIQWDDDDWYGPDRMMQQFKGLKDNAAVMLTEQLHYFRDTGEVAWVEDMNGIEGTLLMDKRCGVRYPAKKRGEDSVLKRELREQGILNLVAGGTCYCRTYHGGNTWDRGHHIERIKVLGKAEDSLDKKMLGEAAKFYGWKKDWKLING